MPVYEYKCQNVKCNNEWEEEASMKDPPQTKCPKCKKKTAKKLISLGSFELKGGGWARDRYSK